MPWQHQEGRALIEAYVVEQVCGVLGVGGVMSGVFLILTFA